MTQQVIAWLTHCEEARGHLRKLRVLVECLPLDDRLEYKDWIRETMVMEIDDCAKALGLKL